MPFNKLKTTPTPNKNGSYGITGGLRMTYFWGSVCHIVCRNLSMLRDSYAIRTPIVWHILGPYFWRIWEVGVVGIVFNHCFGEEEWGRGWDLVREKRFMECNWSEDPIATDANGICSLAWEAKQEGRCGLGPCNYEGKGESPERGATMRVRGKARKGVGRLGGGAKEPARQCARVCQNYPLANYPSVLPNRCTSFRKHCARENIIEEFFSEGSRELSQSLAWNHSWGIIFGAIAQFCCCSSMLPGIDLRDGHIVIAPKYFWRIVSGWITRSSRNHCAK